MKKYIITGIIVIAVAIVAYLIFANRGQTPAPVAPGAPTTTPNALGPTSLPTTTAPSGNPPSASAQTKS